MASLFAFFAVAILIPVGLLGVLMSNNYKRQSTNQNLAEAAMEAHLLATVASGSRSSAIPPVSQLSNLATQQFVAVVESAMRVGEIDGLRVVGDRGSVALTYGNSTSWWPAVIQTQLGAANSTTTATELLNIPAMGGKASRPASVAVVATIPIPLISTNKARPPTAGFLQVEIPYAPLLANAAPVLHSLDMELLIVVACLFFAIGAVLLSLGIRVIRKMRDHAFHVGHDLLTDLPNRTLFHQSLEDALAKAMESRRRVMVAIIDLDRFKEVNDTLGHQNGDLLLKELAKRLREATGPEDTIARMGGDEFGLVIFDAENPEAFLVNLRELINRDVEISGLPLSVEASIGYVIAPEDGANADSLMRRADVAMYVAKAQHQGVVRYDPKHDHYDAANLSLMAEFRHGIDTNQLVLHYQPKAALSTGNVEAVEALVRWQHPSHGLLFPDTFVPLAEQTDLIDKLTIWVLEAALTEIRDLAPNSENLTVSINVSARNLCKADFAKKVVEVVNRVGASADRLIIEITETALLTDPVGAAKVLAELHRAGVRVSIDDFGCGQTSLGYLSELPIHELKIDKSFVFDMLDNAAHNAIVCSVIDLGHNLAFRVVAEGVETEAILDALRNAGCDVAQGYLLARPMPVDKLQKWLSEESRNSATGPGASGIAGTGIHEAAVLAERFMSGTATNLAGLKADEHVDGGKLSATPDEAPVN